MYKKVIPLLFLLFLLTAYSLPQSTDTLATKEELSEVKGAMEGMNETMLEMKTTVDALKKIKVSGYLQAQYQVADSPGVSSYAGGNFPTNVKSRYSVRRGRIKVNYDNDLTQYVIQIDVTQSGVGIKDAYLSIMEPWMRTASLTAGIFDRPFGFEISYSSSNRESPERSRLFQTLFPGERELGAKLELNSAEGLFSYINFKGGFFNGVLNTANENNRHKDFIGRLGFQLPFQEENLAIDGGFSLYSGKVTNNSKYLYSIDANSSTKQYIVDSLSSNYLGHIGRTYYGGDIQIYYDIPPIGGAALRGEYITGEQPGTSSSNVFYNPSSANTPVYKRKFNGWYLMYIQNIGLKNQLILKYDVLDPNSDVEGNDLGKTGTNLTVADIKFSTLGIGWVYHWDSNVKFVLYYDLVMNEKVNSSASGSLAPYRDDIKDNVFTLRVQYKF